MRSLELITRNRIILTCAVGGLLLWFRSTTQHTPDPLSPADKITSPAPIPTSRFLNTSSDASFVGRQACAECHADQDRSYQQTAHSLALAPIDPDDEPEDCEFHAPSADRWYRVFRKEKQLWHRESFRTTDGEEHILAEYPMRWVIGSGRFSKSYLAEADGFLIQSPVTWYNARPGWDLSPGYEQYNSSFERTTEIRCLLCHVGRAEPLAGSFHRVKIHTQAIDCERCHGPGSIHVAMRGSEAQMDGPDLSIVHPARLDREHSEAICAQCHLHGAAMIDIRGRSLTDFRPGLRLSDFSIPYGLETPGKEMQVVGHMEQMRLSRCYQETETMTCTTCHDPHHEPEPSSKVVFYRNTCLKCHEEQSCGLPDTERRQIQADDSCVACHMPESPTEIPHFAFTHHRIGIHDTAQQKTTDSAPQKLVPMADVSHLSQIDQDRGLGLAYLQVADLPEHFQHGEAYRNEAQRILGDVYRRGMRDTAVAAALARLYWQRDERRTIEFAESVLTTKSASPDDRATALFTLATTYFQQGKVENAAPLLEELVQLRRYADAWNALSLCREELGDVAASIEAARRAAEISPLRPNFQQRLAYLYQENNRPDLAAKHRERARHLQELIRGR